MSLVTSVLDPNTDQIHEYEALSYTWGSPNTQYYIDVTAPHEASACPEKKRMSQQSPHTRTGQRLGVTRSLAEALRYLRFKDRPRIMWIDAVCVDQHNLEERGRQVQRMADIYRNAERVLIWTGPASDDSALAIETLRTLGSRIEVNWDLYELENSPGQDSHWADREVALKFNNETWTSIHSLIRRRWFKRLWIWQEVILADMVVMHCGHETLDWNSFRKAIFCIQRKMTPWNIDPKTWRDFVDILGHVHLLIVRTTGRPLLLQWLLGDTKGCECIDPRDRVYALLNLSRRTPGLVGLQPDYTQEPRDIYQEVFLRHLTYEGDLDLLAHCEWHRHIVYKPTWVPDWSRPRLRRPIDLSRACWGSRAEAEFVGSGVLKVTGLYCAEISDIGRNTLDDEAYNSPGYPDIIRMVERLAEHVNFSAPYVDGSDVTEAFCRTVCKDDFSDRHVPALSGYPDLEKTLGFIQILHGGSWSQIEPYRSFLSCVQNAMEGRHFFTSKEGYLGLAPEAVRLGDEVCVILGCHTPMLLRREGDERYVVIGDCYIHGLMNGEALLGPLPPEWRFAWVYVDGIGYLFGFVNQQTGDQVFEDPRLGQLLPGWRLEDQERRADWNNWFVNDETGEKLKWP